MKKLIASLAVVTFLFTMNANAQEKVEAKKTKAKSEMKSCSKDEKKGSCCMAKKGGKA